jgi:hypothetical protein
VLDFDNRICYLCFIKDNKNQSGANMKKEVYLCRIVESSKPIVVEIPDEQCEGKDDIQTNYLFRKHALAIANQVEFTKEDENTTEHRVYAVYDTDQTREPELTA